MKAVTETLDLMMPMAIDSLVSGVKTPCDLYVRLNAQKNILVANSGALVHEAQLQKYRAKSVSQLWIFKNDFHKMIDQTTSLAEIILCRKDVDDKNKANLLSKAASHVFTQIEGLGFDLNTYQFAMRISEAVISLAENHYSLRDLIAALGECSDHLVGHSIAVSLVSTIMAQKMGFTSKVLLEKIALAGLLHDIGMTCLPKELVIKSAAEMTSEEKAQWETHAALGKILLLSLGAVSDDVTQIVFQHHDSSSGHGFLHPLGKIVGVADRFCELTSAGSAREAIDCIKTDEVLAKNKKAFFALQQAIGDEKMDDSIIPDAVVGIVDIVSSSKISSTIGPLNDFQFKSDFLIAASRRASEFNIVILNHTGDGFLFLVNPRSRAHWYHNVIAFYEKLTQDFQQIVKKIHSSTGMELATGLRFGVAQGPIVLGYLGNGTTHFTAVGNDVNLAARLCGTAGKNEIVFSAMAWSSVQVADRARSNRQYSHDFKGFSEGVVGIHIGRVEPSQTDTFQNETAT